ncbi:MULTISPECIES: FadR/GntR family transcriptional regulator [unclassified Rhizobium]|uniref:FadR/GntR family transcriptional regulator n=1 Tax=unclassified Rhizobium TaxID=2613769 RepID=UPI0010435A30|nr:MULTISPECIES: FadR/GntR family transcriptional regulator [unclassified Rhizobium]MBB3397353.1 DNA-binding FadR family transcriptional regulator [Rhizobium sp. BK060]MBB4171557.1 DNA-binding FadR family transcriptional regulator [Rhizobium sp. BK538]TCM71180.1 GntR family transcriptional regulator [Rhizobium sp. BK068]
MTLEKSVRRSQSDTGAHSRVVSFLRDQLLSGELKAGDLLLPERELASQLNVSRPVLREALRALAMVGAVEIRHGVGTVVKRPDVTALGDVFSFMLAHQSDVIGDIMEARKAIEHHAVRLACQRATEQDFARLTDALGYIVETIHDPEQGGLADFQFHEAIVQASHSPTLVTLYASIAQLMMRSHLERREKIIQVEGIEEFLVDHHRSILDALIARDRVAADTLLDKHFEIGADFRRRASLRVIGAASTASSK